MTNKEKTVINMAKFLHDQSLLLIRKLYDLKLPDETSTCQDLHEQAERLYFQLLEKLDNKSH